jgi:mannose-6-phosphate isomerase-like protein (cupin superfamily)
MPKLIAKPTIVAAAGYPPKEIQEFIGRVNSGTDEVSVARMVSPAGWIEPGQTPEFGEYTLVLSGSLHLQFKDRELTVQAGQAVIVEAGQWVQYSTSEGATYIAICVPAFAPQLAHRDA